jgi:hypothetical protein
MPTNEEIAVLLQQYYASQQANDLNGTQAVNAGMIGNGESLNANPPMLNPEALSGKADIAENIITADWTPMEKALLLQLQRQF